MQHAGNAAVHRKRAASQAQVAAQQLQAISATGQCTNAHNAETIYVKSWQWVFDQLCTIFLIKWSPYFSGSLSLSHL